MPSGLCMLFTFQMHRVIDKALNGELNMHKGTALPLLSTHLQFTMMSQSAKAYLQHDDQAYKDSKQVRSMAKLL